MDGRLKAFRRILDTAINTFATAIFLLIFVVILLQVFMRYVMGSPLVWTEELARYLFIWISLVGWTFATRNGTHIRIGFVADSLPPTFSRALSRFNSVLAIVFASAFGYYGFMMMRKNFDVPTITLFFSYAVVYAAAPFSCILMILYSILNLAQGSSDRGSSIS